jgi:hypothetical protein
MSSAVVVPLVSGFGGVFLGWLATFSNERIKWQRERVARWDERRLAQFVAYASALKREVHLCLRLAAAVNLGTMDEGGLDMAEGVPLLNEAEERRADAFEGLLLLADRRTIIAARDWHKAVWKLRETVTGKRTVDQVTFMSLFRLAGKARDEFYLAARTSLSVNSEFARSEKFEASLVEPT